MAKFIASESIAVVSGTTGGTVFSRNAGGGYFKGAVIPTNTHSEKRANTRAKFAETVREYQALTPAQRAAWDAYAAENPVTNRIGQQRTLRGQDWYTRLTNRLKLTGDTPAVLPPTVPPPTYWEILGRRTWYENDDNHIALFKDPQPLNERVVVFAVKASHKTRKNKPSDYKFLSASQVPGVPFAYFDWLHFTTTIGALQLNDYVNLYFFFQNSTNGLRSVIGTLKSKIESI